MLWRAFDKTVRRKPLAGAGDAQRFDCLISPVEIRGDEDRIRTQAFRSYCRHGRSHAETPGLVRSRADDRPVAPPGNDHGLAAQLRIVALLDQSIERVHVDMDDFSHNLLATILFRVLENSVNVYWTGR